MNEDSEKKVRGAAVESIDDLIKEIGPAFIDQSIPALKDALMKLLESDIAEDDSDDEVQGEGEAEDEETELYTFEAICDLIPTLAEYLISGFEPTLSELRTFDPS